MFLLCSPVANEYSTRLPLTLERSKALTAPDTTLPTCKSCQQRLRPCMHTPETSADIQLRVAPAEVMRCPDKREPSENKDQPQLAYSARVDAWACGVLAYELLVGCPPFGMSTREGSIKAILGTEPKIPSWVPEGATDFIRLALTKKASNRPSVRRLLQHPWIQKQMCDLLPLQPVFSVGVRAGCSYCMAYGTRVHLCTHDHYFPVVVLRAEDQHACQRPAPSPQEYLQPVGLREIYV